MSVKTVHLKHLRSRGGLFCMGDKSGDPHAKYHVFGERGDPGICGSQQDVQAVHFRIRDGVFLKTPVLLCVGCRVRHWDDIRESGMNAHQHEH